ncbi:Ran-Binding Protein 6 [Manis pentadactyla]|nr:Ran-Binding Protein 6 [Manis pentadactyla]
MFGEPDDKEKKHGGNGSVFQVEIDVRVTVKEDNLFDCKLLEENEMAIYICFCVCVFFSVLYILSKYSLKSICDETITSLLIFLEKLKAAFPHTRASFMSCTIKRM